MDTPKSHDKTIGTNCNTLLSNEYITNKILQTISRKQSEQCLTEDKHLQAVVDLLNHISYDKEKANDMLFIISAAYEKVSKKFNGISLSILILSSIATLLEAFKLSILEYINNNAEILADTYIISFSMNIVTLSIGTVITILSSIIRFKNYREILEELKDKQNLLITYREKYNKKYGNVLNLLAFDKLTKEDIVSINQKLAEYDNDIKTINVMEYLRNDDIIRFNKYKAYFDFEIRKIDIDKDMAIKTYENLAKRSMKDIEGEKKLVNYKKYMDIKSIKEYILNKSDEKEPVVATSPINAILGELRTV